MQATANPVLVEVLRGDAVESAHRGALVVCDSNGHTVISVGDVKRRVFARSAIKLLQALPLVASGAADHWGFTNEELALACASHNGEATHTSTALTMLHKAGVDDTVLECGAHPPHQMQAQALLMAQGQAPCSLHNNCSGKHAGFVGLGAFRAATGKTPSNARPWLQGYVNHDHTVMMEVSQAVADATSFDLSQTTRATDGCSIPTHAIELKALALAYARVATGDGLSLPHAIAAKKLRHAIAAAPHMVAGTLRFDTLVMQRLGTRVCCKVGAEGVYCAALPEKGWGVAIKMDDGNNARAVEVVMATVIEHLVTLDASERAFMGTLSAPALRNWNGIAVGALRASTWLREGL